MRTVSGTFTDSRMGVSWSLRTKYAIVSSRDSLPIGSVAVCDWQPAVERKAIKSAPPMAFNNQRRQLRFARGRQLRVGVAEGELVVLHVDAHEAALLELAEEQLLRQRLLHV